MNAIGWALIIWSAIATPVLIAYAISETRWWKSRRRSINLFPRQ